MLAFCLDELKLSLNPLQAPPYLKAPICQIHIFPAQGESLV
jgi:hypothetical protein